MIFDYKTLKNAAASGQRLGSWNGKAVFSCSAADLENRGSGAFYVLYDDKNKIVGRDGEFYYSYGTVNESGSVNTFDNCHNYNLVKQEKKIVEVVSDIEATLKKAREMSIDDLLDGFAVGK